MVIYTRRHFSAYLLGKYVAVQVSPRSGRTVRDGRFLTRRDVRAAFNGRYVYYERLNSPGFAFGGFRPELSSEGHLRIGCHDFGLEATSALRKWCGA